MRHRPLALILLASACAAPPPQTAARIPAIPLTSLTAEKQDLAAVAAGKPALIVFWATWCTACEDEFDALNKLDDRAGAKGGLIVGVAVGEPIPTVADFVKKRGLRYRQLVDQDFAFADALGERKVPATLVINREGKV